MCKMKAKQRGGRIHSGAWYPSGYEVAKMLRQKGGRRRGFRRQKGGLYLPRKYDTMDIRFARRMQKGGIFGAIKRGFENFGKTVGSMFGA